MADHIDAALERLVAEEVAAAPPAPSAEAIAAYVAHAGRPPRRWRPPVVAIAAVLALVVAATAVVLPHEWSSETVVPVASTVIRPLPAYVVPTGPAGLRLVDASQSAPGALGVDETVHVFIRVSSTTPDPPMIVVVIQTAGGTHVTGEPVWEDFGDGAGALSFGMDGVAVLAYTRNGVTENDVRIFAAGLRPQGGSAHVGLDPDSGGDFATVDVHRGSGLVPAPPVFTATWALDGGTVRLSLTLPPAGITDSAMLPVAGTVVRVGDRRVIESDSGDARTANWIEQGTWVSISATGTVDLDGFIAGLRPADETAWRQATGLPPAPR
jgi:hypothetical protein